MSQFVVLPRVEIRNANAQPAWWMIGPPPLTAYVGFAHALALAIGATSHEGIAVVHHDIQFLGETHWDFGIETLLPHQFRAASFIDKEDYSSKNPHVLSSQPTARCHLNASLVIRFPDDALFRFSDVTTFLRGGRIAGGTVIGHGKPAYFPPAGEDLAAVTKAVGSGHSIISRQDLMVKTEADRDMLDVVLRLTRPVEKRSDDQKWLQPTSLGYVEITPRQKRRNVRGGFPHAYAEPLVGLVQYRTLREVGLHFWRYHHPRPNVFLASTHQFTGEPS